MIPSNDAGRLTMLDPWKAFQYWTIAILALAVAVGVVGAGVIFALKIAGVM